MVFINKKLLAKKKKTLKLNQNLENCALYSPLVNIMHNHTKI